MDSESMDQKNENTKTALDGLGEEHDLIDLSQDLNRLGIQNEDVLPSLNDYVLEEIFMYLDPYQLINVEKVCQRWKDICQNVWKQIRELDFFYPCSNFCHLEEQLSRCGEYITSLSYPDENFRCDDCMSNSDNTDDNKKPDSDYEISQKIVGSVVTHCRNLTSLALYIPDATVLKTLAECEFLPNLTLLCLMDMQILDDLLELILEKATSLETLNLNSTTLLQGQSLLKLSTTCTYLIISGCDDLKKDILVHVFARLSNLVDIGAMGCKSMFFDVLPNQYYVTTLAVQETMFFKDFSEAYLLLMDSYLPNLTHLELTDNSYVTNAVLDALRQLCPNLEVLDISGCYSSSKDTGVEISNFGIGQLVTLPKLRHLKLNDLPKLNFDDIASFASLNFRNFNQLRKLKCRNSGQDEMTAAGLSSMINICPQLEILDFTENFYVTNHFLMDTFLDIRQRTDDTELIIMLSYKPEIDFVLFEKYLGRHHQYISFIKWDSPQDCSSE